jgi:hypothetical protein
MRLVLSLILALVLIPLCLAPSVASRRVVYSSSISFVLFMGWIVCMAYAFATGTLPDPAVIQNPGTLWEGPGKIL